MNKDKKHWNLGLYDEFPQTVFTGEEELALWHKNGQNRPYTRVSEAHQALLRRKINKSYRSKQSPSSFTAQEVEGRAEQERLIAKAREKGFFFSDDAPVIESIAKEKNYGGTEHDVYIIGDAQNRLVVRSTIAGSFGNTSSHSPAQYLQRLKDYNTLFPTIQTRLIGVGQRPDSTVIIWTVQIFVPGEEFSSQSDLDKYMRARGWFEIGEHSHKYRHKTTNAIIEDVHPGNILYVDSQLYPIDVIVVQLP